MEEKEMKSYEQQAVPVVLVPQQMEEDEINLIDFWDAIVRRKILVIGVMLVCLVASVAYAVFTPPVYRAEAHLLPPLPSQLDGLVGSEYTPAKVYTSFMQNLHSRALRRLYFDKHKLLDSLAPGGGANADDVFEQMFNAKLIVNASKGNKGAVTVSLEGNDASSVAQWLNGFIDMVNRRNVQMLIQDANSALNNRIQGLRDRISVMRESFRQRQKDKMAKLEEAIRIAENLGLKEIMVIPNKNAVAINISPSNNNDAGSQSSEGFPLYMMGYKALKAELMVLRQRKSDDAYIPGLRDLQEKLSLLRGKRFDLAHISSVRIDQSAIVPDHRIKPKRRAIVALGLIVGAMMGVFAALFADFVGRARRQRKTTA